MFVDASAVVAILTFEDEKAAFEAELQGANRILISPVAIYESVLAVARKIECSIGIAQRSVERFCEDADAEIIPITAEIGSAALAAFASYGKTRHPAGLNMGDCFSYACAKHHQVPILCKGDDFRQTDLLIVGQPS